MNAALKLDATLHALADPTRRRVVELLREKPRRAGELAAAFEMVPPAMSRHLRVLRASGLVEEAATADDARVRMYRLRGEPFSALREWLEQVEAFWADQLSAFKGYAEQETTAVRARRTRKLGPGQARARSTTRGGKRARGQR